MSIFLSGGGSGERSKNVDLAFISRINKGKPVLYIPLARNAPYDSCINWIKSNFQPLGFNNFKMVDAPEKLKTINLSDYSSVYIGGGNTYKLLSDLQTSGFLSTLKKYIKEGGIFYGGSAGAIIVGKEIGTATSENERNLKDTKGLNLVDEFSIDCEYNGQDSTILDYIKLKHINVIAIPENAGVLIEDKKIEVIGPGKVTVFGSNGSKRTLVQGSFID